MIIPDFLGRGELTFLLTFDQNFGILAFPIDHNDSVVEGEGALEKVRIANFQDFSAESKY